MCVCACVRVRVRVNIHCSTAMVVTWLTTCKVRSLSCLRHVAVSTFIAHCDVILNFLKLYMRMLL